MSPAAWGAIIGGAKGLLDYGKAKDEWRRKGRMAQAMARWSPYTGDNSWAQIAASNQRPNALNLGVQGAIRGAAVGKSLGTAFGGGGGGSLAQLAGNMRVSAGGEKASPDTEQGTSFEKHKAAAEGLKNMLGPETPPPADTGAGGEIGPYGPQATDSMPIPNYAGGLPQSFNSLSPQQFGARPMGVGAMQNVMDARNMAITQQNPQRQNLLAALMGTQHGEIW